ncbi:glycerophosphodiester phosphodiesterase [Alteromonadaceae bacterium BrNp21-10]|nr:glycerophosphodiester phosphodiesterase [Alteromonadaceae bacterium BrNp21-10]
MTIKRALLALLLCIIFLLGVGYLTASNAPRSTLFTQHPQFLTIAHQGGYLLWPSNTLYAFEKAAKLGVDMLEMDIHQSQDGFLVVMHDETVDRTTDGTGLIKEKTLVELKKLDAGYHWLEATPKDDKIFRDKEITIPTLDEVFFHFNDKLMTIEIKQQSPSIVNNLCTTIHQYKMQDKVIIGSFHQDALDEFRQHCPDVATSMASAETTVFVLLSKLGLSGLFSPKGNALQVPVYSSGLTVITPDFIENAHAKGLKVHAWTINDPWQMRDLKKMGVDGLISDRPDYLLNID